MASRPNTSRQAVLTFTRAYIKAKGYSPTLKEIADATHFSLMTAHRALRMLAKLKLVTVTPGKQRSIRLVERKAVTR